MKKIDFILIHTFTSDKTAQQNKINRQRIDYGIKLYNELSGSNIIIAGKIDYAEIGYLKNTGIPKDKIYEESNGTNTYDCTLNSFKRIIIPNKWKAGIIVSSLEHLPRVLIQTTKIMRQIGIDKDWIRLFYSGCPIEYLGESNKVIDAFKKHESEGIKYTLSRTD